MRKRECTNRMSLRGVDNINTVIAPSEYVRSCDLRIRRIIKGLIGRSLDDCLRNRGMTVNKYLRNRGMTFDTVILGHILFLQVILGQQRVTRVSIDPRVKPEGDGRRRAPEGDESGKSSLRGGNRGLAIFELGKNKLIRRSLEFFALQKIGVTICYILISSMSMVGTVKAECTPTPDCASIGYTATSCEGGFVRCPFDTSKLFCVPCDTQYKYTCSGDNIIGGTGSPCNGKYISCECSGGGTFTNGECPQNCEVGYIYYSDKSCSVDYDSSKTPIGVVVKKNELVMSKDRVVMSWSSAHTNTSLTDMSSYQAQADMNGKSNTAVIVAAHPSETISNNAAIYCNKYTTTGTSAGDWYLPAAGELYSYVYGNNNTLSSVYTGSLGWSSFSSYFWSSSERSDGLAWFVYSGGGDVTSDNKRDDYYSVSCFLDIS